MAEEKRPKKVKRTCAYCRGLGKVDDPDNPGKRKRCERCGGAGFYWIQE